MRGIGGAECALRTVTLCNIWNIDGATWVRVVGSFGNPARGTEARRHVVAQARGHEGTKGRMFGAYWVRSERPCGKKSFRGGTGFGVSGCVYYYCGDIGASSCQKTPSKPRPFQIPKTSRWVRGTYERGRMSEEPGRCEVRDYVITWGRDSVRREARAEGARVDVGGNERRRRLHAPAPLSRTAASARGFGGARIDRNGGTTLRL